MTFEIINMKYFLSLILLSVISISCAQEFKIINANKTAFYTGTSGFSGWNIKIEVKEKSKNIVYHYLLKDEQKCKIETKKLDAYQVELLTYEDLTPVRLKYGEVAKKRVPDTNTGQLFYSIGPNATLKSIWINEFKIVESKGKALHQ